jgi:hypothetical protein
MDRTERHLRAGLALYTAGEYHAAHDPWEHRWLELGAAREAEPDDTTGAVDAPDRRLLQGLIQTTAAVYHAQDGNRAGATGLAESARGYLGSLDANYRGVALAPVLEFLGTLAVTPETVDREGAVPIDFEGTPVDVATEEFETVVLAVEALAEEHDLDTGTVERAVEYGRADLDDGVASSPFVSLLVDLVGTENRALVVKRLGDHVARREHRESGVDGLFDVE